mmetsp:Transcript_5020/g.14811  ORF Transcript_5020/g.14811 Transcript_5020/m.14811 type:complete len:217 (-) Transcript_5020:682-1332(-)
MGVVGASEALAGQATPLARVRLLAMEPRLARPGRREADGRWTASTFRIWVSRTPGQARAQASSQHQRLGSAPPTTGRGTPLSLRTTLQRGASTRAWPCSSASSVSSTSCRSSHMPWPSRLPRTPRSRGPWARQPPAWPSRATAWRRAAAAACPCSASLCLASWSACARATRARQRASSARRSCTSDTCSKPSWLRRWKAASRWANSRSCSRCAAST